MDAITISPMFTFSLAAWDLKRNEIYSLIDPFHNIIGGPDSETPAYASGTLLKNDIIKKSPTGKNQAAEDLLSFVH
jgi:hypothetical protein